jgi:glycosyltransferase involved in cell wall biosynthesis
VKRPRIGFVVQRCGDDIAGGAERLCLETARHMGSAWDAEILTTCARDARTWADAYAPGPDTIAGVPARRFSVPIPRDPAAFDRLSRGIGRPATTLAEQEAWMHAQGPVAPGLVAHLTRECEAYDAVLFYSYLYATTYFGLPPVADRAVLVPLAHDEWTLDLPLFGNVFEAPRALAFLSEEERALVARRFPDTVERGQVVGVGIEAPPVDPARFRRAHGLEGELLVCVGRVEEAKGTPELIDYFCALQSRQPERRTLVLVGPVAMDVPRRDDIVALGQLPEQDKWDALAAAAFACIPSAFESLSLAALEAWAVGTAVLANGASAVLIGHCRRANAGLWYATCQEFVELAQSRLYGRATELGRNGAAYVGRNYTWDATRRRLRSLLADMYP